MVKFRRQSRSMAALAMIALLAACGASEQAQMQCLADYTVAYRLEQKALIESSPKPESPYEQTAAQTKAALMPDKDLGWSDCPQDFRDARNAALGKLAEMSAAMDDMRGQTIDGAAFESFRPYADAFEAEFLAFIAIYADYLEDPRVEAAIGDRLNAPAREFFDALRR